MKSRLSIKYCIGEKEIKIINKVKISLHLNFQQNLNLILGLLMGISIRTRKPIPLNLAPIVWKLILNCQVNNSDLQDIDLHFVRGLTALASDKQVRRIKNIDNLLC